MTAEEKRKEILQKYGFKDRSQMNVEAISDTEDDSAVEEVDMKELTDKELAEKYNLPYVPDSSDLYRGRSDSTSSFTGLLSKIRQAGAEKKLWHLHKKTMDRSCVSLSPQYLPIFLLLSRHKKNFSMIWPHIHR